MKGRPLAGWPSASQDIPPLKPSQSPTCARLAGPTHGVLQHITCFLHGPIGFDLGMSSVLYLRDSPSGKLICKQVGCCWPLPASPAPCPVRPAHRNGPGVGAVTPLMSSAAAATGPQLCTACLMLCSLRPQVDLHQFESILYHWTLLGPLLEVLVRGVVTMQILGSARLAAWAWGLVERGWSAALPATATADGASAFGAPEAQGKAAEGSRAGASAGQGACARSGVLRWVQRAAAAVWWREWLWRSRPGRLTVPYNMQ